MEEKSGWGPSTLLRVTADAVRMWLDYFEIVRIVKGRL